jgi:hypothetical protein
MNRFFNWNLKVRTIDRLSQKTINWSQWNRVYRLTIKVMNLQPFFSVNKINDKKK